MGFKDSLKSVVLLLSLDCRIVRILFHPQGSYTLMGFKDSLEHVAFKESQEFYDMIGSLWKQ